MRSTLTLTLSLAALAGGLAPGAALHAQPRSGEDAAVTEERPVATLADSIAAVNGELRRKIGSAERAMSRGRLDDAREKYESVVALMREHRLLPAEALWRLATIHYAEGNALRAAATLDALACEAEAHRNVQVQVSALVEAGRVYETAGLTAQSVERLKRAVDLLDSAELSREVVATLVRRIRE